jgi:chromosome segregation ATPase
LTETDELRAENERLRIANAELRDGHPELDTASAVVEWRTAAQQIAAERDDARSQLADAKNQYAHLEQTLIRWGTSKRDAEARLEAVVRAAEGVARRIPSPFADNVVSAVKRAAECSRHEDATGSGGLA